MIQDRVRIRRSPKGFILGFGAPLLAMIAASAPASAGEFDRSADAPDLAGQTRCESHGGGPATAEAQEGCVRISGYIAAGVTFAPDGRPAPFGPPAAPGIVMSAGALRGPLLDLAPAPDHFFLQAGDGAAVR